MSLVDVHNEWDPLEEVIVGVVDGARVPSPDRGLFALDYCDNVDSPRRHPDRAVRRPGDRRDPGGPGGAGGAVPLRGRDGAPAGRSPTTPSGSARPDWTADGEYNYCPRDLLLPIGDTIIETPMANRTRYFETFAYRDLLREYFDSGANWISAPKPQLLDDTYNIRPADGVVLNDHEPVFDAANVLRVGEDILYLVSCSGNERGLRWLQRVLGERYRVHAVRDVYSGHPPRHHHHPGAAGTGGDQPGAGQARPGAGDLRRLGDPVVPGPGRPGLCLGLPAGLDLAGHELHDDPARPRGGQRYPGQPDPRTGEAGRHRRAGPAAPHPDAVRRLPLRHPRHPAAPGRWRTIGDPAG